MRKFIFNNFSSYFLIGDGVDYKRNYNSRMISAFIFYDWQKFVIFFLKKADEAYTNACYYIAFYSYG